MPTLKPKETLEDLYMHPELVNNPVGKLEHKVEWIIARLEKLENKVEVLEEDAHEH